MRILLLFVVLLAMATFLTGLNWGLPSREADDVLFGGSRPWTGQKIMDLAGPWEEQGPRGADIAMHPLSSQRQQPIPLNDTDAKRAQIVRRYRLYSSQPDEMITFRSLSRMKPSRLDLDPRLYQYGGLWIYPVGLLLKVCSLCHITTLRADPAYYLDHPASFARFYLVARAYSAAWGLVGLLVVYGIGREWTGSAAVGIAAAGVYAAMPVVIDLAHEAKPHLPGAVLTFLAVWSAMKYVHQHQRRWWMLAGFFAGAAMGMVLTGYVAFAVLPVMTLLRPLAWPARLRITLLASLIALATFAITNPYLPLNLLFHRQVLHSNVGNYGTFYQPKLTGSALLFSGESIFEGTSPLPGIIGVLGVLGPLLGLGAKSLPQGDHGATDAGSEVLRRAGFFSVRSGSSEYLRTGVWGSEVSSGLYPTSPRTGLLIAAPAIVVLIQFVLLADGKTAEYGRFALLPDIALALAAAALIGRLPISWRERALASTLVVALTLFFGSRYDLNFIADNRPDSTRRVAARVIQRLESQSNHLAVWAEPAPYCMPPVDLFHWKIILLPKDVQATGTNSITVRPADGPTPIPPGAAKIDSVIEPDRPDSPISWANKPFEILKR